MNKYYTPEIEEFHFGFEFESNYVLFGKDWTKVVLSEEHDWFYSSYVNDAVPTEFRVKYLDKEDIESLGWIYNDISKEFNYKFKKEFNYRLWFSPNNPDLFSIRIEGWYSREGKIDAKFDMFLGNLKNKSELKKLMQQLHIL